MAAFLTEAGREVDPLSYSLLAENLGLSPDQCLGVKMFHAHLLSMAPLVAKAGPSKNAGSAGEIQRSEKGSCRVQDGILPVGGKSALKTGSLPVSMPGGPRSARAGPGRVHDAVSVPRPSTGGRRRPV